MNRTPQRTTRDYNFPAYRPPGRQAVAAWDHAGIFFWKDFEGDGAMTREAFVREMVKAMIFARLRKDPYYWEGYQRGLRRAYYGEIFRHRGGAQLVACPGRGRGGRDTAGAWPGLP